MGVVGRDVREEGVMGMPRPLVEMPDCMNGGVCCCRTPSASSLTPCADRAASSSSVLCAVSGCVERKKTFRRLQDSLVGGSVCFGTLTWDCCACSWRCCSASTSRWSDISFVA